MITCLVTTSYVQVCIGSVYAYFVHGQLTSILGTLLPFTNADSEFSFMINNGHQMVIATFALIGGVTIEIIAVLITNVVSLAPKLIQLNMENLEYDLNNGGWTRKTKAKLRNILIQVQYLDR